MSGLMEILIIVAIILGIFLLPRALRRQPEPDKSTNRLLKLNGWLRIAIIASFIWPAFFAFYLQPWNTKWHIFIYAGLIPVILSWGVFWIILGFRKNDK